MSMVVDMGFSAVMVLLIFMVVIVAMQKLTMVVLVCMPGCPMLPFAKHTAATVMGNMVVVVCMDHGRMCVLRFGASRFNALRNHSRNLLCVSLFREPG
jgi:hypothetical protein